MKKIRSKSKKGFTLVELIVVLVILAILAAMLVPALTGYIRRARQEKEFQAASTVLTATQVLVTEAYGNEDADYSNVSIAKLEDLTGLSLKTVTFEVSSATTGANAYTVTGITVSFDGTNYYHYADGAWKADTTAGTETNTATATASTTGGDTTGGDTTGG